MAALLPPASSVANARPLAFLGPPQQRRQEYGLGEWRLTVATDRFSREVRCRLRTRRDDVVYAANALGFRFDERADTIRAWYRVDDGPPAAWRDVLPKLAAQGTPIDGSQLDAPTGGIVWLPADDLRRASSVAVQIRRRARPRTFRIDRFAEVRASAQFLGCTGEAQFSR